MHTLKRFWLRVTVLAAASTIALMFGVEPSVAMAKSVTYEVVTNEIAAKQADGSKDEVYRFDPAVYVATEGDDLTLRIRGLKGHDHPVVLEGYNVRGVVHRNQVTTLHVHAVKPGFFRLICTAHKDANHNGPMEAYVVVIPSKAEKAATARAAATSAAPTRTPANNSKPVRAKSSHAPETVLVPAI